MAHSSGADDAITIAIADNDPITLRALESILGRDFTVLWTELSGRTAVIRCVEDRQIPDVLLLDMALSDAPGPRVCRCLRANLDTMPILAITSYPLEAFAERAAENGAQGIVGKADIGAMARAITMLAEGMVLPPSARCANAVFRSAARDHEEMARRPLPDDMTLSSREIEILELIIRGLTQQEISRRLDVSGVTVRTYTKRLREKLHCSTLEQAAARWVALRGDYPRFRHEGRR